MIRGWLSYRGFVASKVWFMDAKENLVMCMEALNFSKTKKLQRRYK